MTLLNEPFNNAAVRNELDESTVPSCIVNNLKYPVRPYQLEAFKRFLYLEKQGAQHNHVLFNMATGSGKTLVMAGLILHLYEKGMRNFLFFVNSNNIISKTKDNFLNAQSSKYLFSHKIGIEGREVRIKEVQNFEEADSLHINIHFTTIQQLHVDLNTVKENSITFEDFKQHKIALIADEAHHLNASTKNNISKTGSWEGTVEEILKQHEYNLLLEFTATLDQESKAIVEKYQEKVIYKYDLAQFRLDKYSKEIVLVRSHYDEQDRILQALIINLYKQELALSHGIDLKPVILFKAKQTIKESELNKERFHKLIEKLDLSMIDALQQSADIPLVKNAFTFFKNSKLSKSELVTRLKSNFNPVNCISANNDNEAQKNQLLLNSLEDAANPICAVFAVHKLNEGWDVLNLFDIVRLYEGENAGATRKKPAKTTLSEAQLIGRGARYFPFAIVKGQDRYKRKYDDDLTNPLRILEELHYHTKEDNSYINDLKNVLVLSGIYKDTEFKKPVSVGHKIQSQKTKNDTNNKQNKQTQPANSLADLGIKTSTVTYILSSGNSAATTLFNKDYDDDNLMEVIENSLKISQLPLHVVRYALSQNPSYHFSNLVQFLPLLKSIDAFITEPHYLGNAVIIFKGSASQLQQLTHQEILRALQQLLQTMAAEFKRYL